MFHKDMHTCFHCFSSVFLHYVSPAGVLWGKGGHWPQSLDTVPSQCDGHTITASLPQVSAENEVS